MRTDAQAIEHELHPQSVQSKAEKAVLRAVPGPPAKLLDLLHFLMFISPRELLNIYINAARQHGDVVRFRGGRGGPILSVIRTTSNTSCKTTTTTSARKISLTICLNWLLGKACFSPRKDRKLCHGHD